MIKNSSTIIDAVKSQEEKFKEIEEFSRMIRELDYKFKEVAVQIRNLYNICFKNFLYKNVFVGNINDIYDDGGVRDNEVKLYICKSGFKIKNSDYRSKKPRNINEWNGDVFIKNLKEIAKDKDKFAESIIDPTKKNLFLNFLNNLEQIPYIKIIEIFSDLNVKDIIKFDIFEFGIIKKFYLDKDLVLKIEYRRLARKGVLGERYEDNKLIRLSNNLDYSERIVLEQIYEQVINMLNEALKNRNERVNKIQSYLEYLKVAMADYVTLYELEQGWK